jgi:DNA polymerase
MPEEKNDITTRIEKYLNHQHEVFGSFFIDWEKELEKYQSSEPEVTTSPEKETPETPKPEPVSIHPGEENDEAFARKDTPSPVGLFNQPDNGDDDKKDEAKAEPELDPEKETIQKQLAACTTLDELKKLCIKHEDQLKTDLDGANLVFGVGNPNADLVIVGEAPGQEEDKQGEPFVGAAGQLLDKIMGAINLSRDEFYIANILKFRPPDNRNPRPDECAKSLPFLERQIDIINPRIILCVGKFAAITLLNKTEQTSLSSLRGEFHQYRNYPLLATYHPAALLRNDKWKRPTWNDIKMLRGKYDELTT